MTTNYLTRVAHEWKMIVATGVIVALLAAALSFLRPLEYSSTIRLLVVPRSTLGLDPYLAIRSSERISDNLASIIRTNSFFEKVVAADPAIDRGYWSTQETKKRRAWQRMISAEVGRGGGLLAITVYHRNRDEAARLARAIGAVLQVEGSTYVGGGDLQIQIVDTPITSRWPARPNIPLQAASGLLLGLIASMLFVLYGRHGRYEGRGFLHEG